MWLHHNGALSLSRTTPLGGEKHGDGLPKIQVNRWTCITIVVDGGLPDGKITLYVNDNDQSYCSYSLPGLGDIDGDCSILENRVTLFGTKDIKQCHGACLRNFVIIPRVLAGIEINEIVRGVIKDSNSNVLNTVANQLVSMGFTEDIAHWAASNSSGDSIEDRVMNAFALLSNDS